MAIIAHRNGSSIYVVTILAASVEVHKVSSDSEAVDIIRQAARRQGIPLPIERVYNG